MGVPVVDWQLAGDDGGSAPVTIVNDFQEVAPLLGIERRQSPVIEDQYLNPRQALEHAGISSVATRQHLVGANAAAAPVKAAHP